MSTTHSDMVTWRSGVVRIPRWGERVALRVELVALVELVEFELSLSWVAFGRWLPPIHIIITPTHNLVAREIFRSLEDLAERGGEKCRTVGRIKSDTFQKGSVLGFPAKLDFRDLILRTGFRNMSG